VRRVLLVSWGYPPVVEGGLARHVRGVAEGLAARGDEVHVLTRGEGEDLAEEVCAGVHVQRVAVTAMPYDLDTRLGAAGREHARRVSWTDVARRTAAVHAALLERRATVRS
jgi:hypothetical protein